MGVGLGVGGFFSGVTSSGSNKAKRWDYFKVNLNSLLEKQKAEGSGK